MRCDQARHLFDAYLDDELSPSQATELGAHRLSCPDCRQALALLEVSGHIIASDHDPVTAPAHFTGRLLACIDAPQSAGMRKFRRVIYIGGPMAAAAMIVLAFLGVFNRPSSRESHVLGKKDVLMHTTPSVAEASALAAPPSSPAAAEQAAEAARQRGEEWLRDVRGNVDTVQRLNLTVLQWMEFLKESQGIRRPDSHEHGPDIEGPLDSAESDEDEPETGSEIEDL